MLGFAPRTSVEPTTPALGTVPGRSIDHVKATDTKPATWQATNKETP